MTHADARRRRQPGSVRIHMSPIAAARGTTFRERAAAGPASGIWTSDRTQASIYEQDSDGSLLSSFDSPSSGPTGLGHDANVCIWSSDGSGSVYQTTQGGSEISSFKSPCFRPRGNGIDSSGCIWHGDDKAQSIYQLTTGGSIVSQFQQINNNRPRGMGVDSGDCLWHVNKGDKIYVLDQNVNIVNQTQSPSTSHYGMGVADNDSVWTANSYSDSVYNLRDRFICISGVGAINGIGHDSANSIWLSDRSNNQIVKIDDTGSGITSFTSPSTRPTGLGLDSSDSIWNSDASGTGATESLYKVTNAGSVITSLSAPSEDPQGIDVDSAGCLWNSDSTAASFYKLTTGGSQITSFKAPSNSPADLSIPSDDCIWSLGRNSGGYVNKLTTGGSVVSSFQHNSKMMGTPEGGLSYGPNCMWLGNELNGTVHFYTRSGDGVYIKAIAAPSGKPTGVTTTY